jgi:hypothetical protein
MQPDWSIILSACGLGVIIVGGYVKLRLAMAADYKAISDRLLKIETRLEMDDRGADDRRDARRREMMAIARSVVEVEMSKTSSTNPRMQVYQGEIEP